MEVNPGYKQTDVGVIPKEWDVKSLGSVLRKGRLGGNYPNQDAVTELPLMKMGNLSRGYFDLSKVQFIVPGVRTDFSHRLVYGDVLFNTRNTLDLVGKVAIWRNELPIAYYNSNLLRLEFDAEQVSSNEYANYSLNTEASVSRLRSLATGTTSVAAIYTRDLLKLQLIVPPPPEQCAIAEALSDVDGLLGGLDRLIAKKRDLKQAAMQQLLTGQTRLPGFHGEWEVKRLGSLLKVRHGKSQHGIVVPDGEFPILASGGEIGRTNTALYNKPSVLIGRKGTIDVPQYADTPFWTVDTLFFTEISDGTDAKFVFYKFTQIPWRSHNEASGVPSLNAKTIENIELEIPPIEAEQTAIAQVLSEMDAELAALEQRREKTRALKQAMMQELLTGRIRLVPPAANVIPEDFRTPVPQAETKPAAGKSHNWAINEAVVVAVLAKTFGSEKFPLGRKRCTKLSYLLHRHVEHVAEGYLKKAAGPYNPAVKYRGPEGIAQKNGYVRAHKNGHFSGYIAAEKITQAEDYFQKWYGKDVLHWLEQFRHHKNDDLELLATVDMAMEELHRAGKEISLATVRNLIASEPEWVPKLDRTAFSDQNITTALTRCTELFPR